MSRIASFDVSYVEEIPSLEWYARRAMHVTTLREIKSRITVYIRDNEYVACTTHAF